MNNFLKTKRLAWGSYLLLALMLAYALFFWATRLEHDSRPLWAMTEENTR